MNVAKSRPLSANDVADWFINMTDRQTGALITAPMVQKLVFFAQAWYLANKGRPLFQEEIVAWSRGPVVRSIFERFENFRYEAIPEIDNAREIKGDKLLLLEGVQERYGCYSAVKLEALATEPDGPWAAARRGVSPEAHSDNIISKQALQVFYGEKIAADR